MVMQRLDEVAASLRRYRDEIARLVRDEQRGPGQAKTVRSDRTVERKLRGCALLLLLTLPGVPAQSQEISPDGRSVVGHETFLDHVVNLLQPDRLLIGLTSDELLTHGEALYPEEGKLHNRAGHRLGARILTGRFGPVAANALGIANEVFEAWNLAHTGHPYFSTQRFDWEDVAANVRGTVDSLRNDLNTPWGAVQMLEMLSRCPLTTGPVSSAGAGTLQVIGWAMPRGHPVSYWDTWVRGEFVGFRTLAHVAAHEVCHVRGLWDETATEWCARWTVRQTDCSEAHHGNRTPREKAPHALAQE